MIREEIDEKEVQALAAEARRIVKRGEVLEEQGKIEDAVLCWESVDEEYLPLRIQSKLGLMYKRGDQVPRNPDRALHWLWNASLVYPKEIRPELADLYMERGLYSKACFQYEQAGKYGNTECYMKLAQMYAEGNPVPQSLEKAIHYYDLAAAQGNKEAEELKNRIVESEYSSFDEIADKAEENDGYACYLLGCHYMDNNHDMGSAITWLKKACNLEFEKAYVKLGEIYEYCGALGQALYWYKEGERKLLSSECQYKMGLCYEKQKDYESALKCYDFASADRYYPAMNRMAELYIEGDLLDMDLTKAASFLVDAYKGGYAPAILQVGQLQIKNKEYKRGRESFEEALKAGLNDAYYYLGQYYMENYKQYEVGGDVFGNSKDYFKAGEYFAKLDPSSELFEKGKNQMHFIMKKMHESPIYTYGQKKVVELFVSLMDGEDLCYEIAETYAEGINIRKDSKEALYWYIKAMQEGNPEAVRKMILIYKRNKEYKDMLACYDALASEATVSEMIDAAKLAHSMKEQKKEFLWFQKAADEGDMESQFKTGQNYEKGIGCILDLKKAFEYYEKASEQGHADAYYKLGEFYEKGIAVECNKTTAIEYYKKARKYGNMKASEALKRLKKKKRFL